MAQGGSRCTADGEVFQLACECEYLFSAIGPATSLYTQSFTGIDAFVSKRVLVTSLPLEKVDWVRKDEKVSGLMKMLCIKKV